MLGRTTIRKHCSNPIFPGGTDYTGAKIDLKLKMVGIREVKLSSSDTLGSSGTQPQCSAIVMQV